MTVAMVFVVLILSGLIPAVVARIKGHSFPLWWAYGTVLLPIALPHALLAEKATGDSGVAPSGFQRCPSCDGRVSATAVKCRQCGYLLRKKSEPGLGNTWNTTGDGEPASGPAMSWDDEFARVSSMGPGTSSPTPSRVPLARRKPVVAAVAAVSIGALALAAATTMDALGLFPADFDGEEALKTAEAQANAEREPALPSQPLMMENAQVGTSPSPVPSSPEPTSAPAAPDRAASPAPATRDSQFQSPSAPTDSASSSPLPAPPASPSSSATDPVESAAGDTDAEKSNSASPPVAGHDDPRAGTAPAAGEIPSPPAMQRDRAVPDRIAGLPTDSRAGPDRNRGERPPSARAAPPMTGMVAGEEVQAVGEVVAWLQGSLKEFGYYDGPIDGKAGLRTQQAIRAYQKARHMTPHGRINHALLVSVRRSLKRAP